MIGHEIKKDYTWLPAKFPVHKESECHPHCVSEMAGSFDNFDGESTEYDVLNWLHSTIRVLKPERVLETGAAHGLGTVAMAHACKMNGFGKVHSLDINDKRAEEAQTLLAEEHLLQYAQVHVTDSLEFLSKTDLIFDIGFFDSDVIIRPKECKICMDRKILKRLAVFHDTSPTRCVSAPGYDGGEPYRIEIFKSIPREKYTGYFDSILSRGFLAFFLK